MADPMCTGNCPHERAADCAFDWLEHYRAIPREELEEAYLGQMAERDEPTPEVRLAMSERIDEPVNW